MKIKTTVTITTVSFFDRENLPSKIKNEDTHGLETWIRKNKKKIEKGLVESLDCSKVELNTIKVEEVEE